MDDKSRYGGEKGSALKNFVERNKSEASVFDGRTQSQNSINSAKKSKFSTLSKEQLDKFFKEKKAKLEEDTQSRLS